RRQASRIAWSERHSTSRPSGSTVIVNVSLMRGPSLPGGGSVASPGSSAPPEPWRRCQGLRVDGEEGVVEFALDVEDALGELVLGPVDGGEVRSGPVAQAGEDLVAVT